MNDLTPHENAKFGTCKIAEEWEDMFASAKRYIRITDDNCTAVEAV